MIRQQLDDNNVFLRLYGRIKSRCVAHKRTLGKMSSTGDMSVDEKYNDVESLAKLGLKICFRGSLSVSTDFLDLFLLL